MKHKFTFYIDPDDILGDNAQFDHSESHHISAVLRISSGEKVTAADGQGNRYEIRLEERVDDCWNGKIINKAIHEPEAPLSLAVSLPCLREDRWQTALEACCEMGVSQVWLVDYDNSLSKWTKTRIEKAHRKAIEILKQSGGSYLTAIEGPTSIYDMILNVNFSEIWVAHPSGKLLSSISKQAALVIGPEGDLSDREQEALIKAGSKLFTLGSRRLRSEIAVVVAISQAALKFETE